jgi:hypothetical protein
MSFKSAVLAVLTLAATAVPAFAGEGKFSALLFGDAYWMAANHDSTIEDMNGLWIRRVHLTYDHKFDDAWSARLRLEAAQPGDFKTAGTISAFMKDAFIKYQHNAHAALIGIQPSPTLATYEDVWGYRSVEKVPVELQGLGSSRDAGIGLQGDFGASKKVGYHILVGNGNNYNGEDNTRKKTMGAIHIRPTTHMILEGYADYDARVGSADRVTFYGFAGWQADKMRAGVQYAKQTRKEVGEDQDYRILSGFVTGALKDKLWLFGRVDRNMDPNPQGPSIAYMPFASVSANTFFIAGADFMVADGVDIMPNVEITVYDDPKVAGPPKPDTDVMARLTFQAKF